MISISGGRPSLLTTSTIEALTWIGSPTISRPGDRLLPVSDRSSNNSGCKAKRHRSLRSPSFQVKKINDPMHPTNEPSCLRSARRCGARTRSGRPCSSPAVRGKARCRMHGGAKGSGGPRGERNGNYRRGHYTKEKLEELAMLHAKLRLTRAKVRFFLRTQKRTRARR